MQCSVCGSQDTKPVQGISKKTGKPYKAYDCNEPGCKNERGYANRTFPTFGSQRASNAQKTAYVATDSNPISGIEKKLDQILAILKTNFNAPTVLKQDIEQNSGDIF